MIEPREDAAPDIKVEVDFTELEMVVYIADLRVVGYAHFGVGHRASSRRASDFIRAFADERLTLSRVRIYDKATNELLDTSPFVIVNLSKVDLIYARDEDGDEAEPTAGPNA